ncbi:hypothetical protein NP493_114g05036 [Ridgeia piscesae]|uniref:Uncharacterized protein n=1 Tax=Ridgeia piscesae TaxID=27915 RepID=A0AAD9P6X2_RIDPI|nr:hypothetical protein NP493_114g05036 [Ridgeia piscesae]
MLVAAESDDIVLDSVDEELAKVNRFRFDAASPGVVFMKAARDSPEEQFRLMGDSDTSLPSTPPVAIEPPGLSHDRQQYLHSHIRPFVKEEWKDVLCPRPTERADSPVAGPSTAPEAGPSTAVASIVRRGGKRGRGRPPRQPSPSPTQPARKRTRGRGRGGVVAVLAGVVAVMPMFELLWDSVALSTSLTMTSLS